MKTSIFLYIFIVFKLFCYIDVSVGKPIQCLIDSNGIEHYYDVIHKECTWVEANEDSKLKQYKGLRGHLAVISSVDEQNYIWKIFPYPGYFLGGFQVNNSNEPNGNWTWVTDEKWDFSNWDENEPNNEDNNEQYLQFSESENGTWNDVRNKLVSKGYIIEYEKPITSSNIEYNITDFTKKSSLITTKSNKSSNVTDIPKYLKETKMLVNNNQNEIKEILKKQQSILYSHNLLLDQIQQYINTKPNRNQQASTVEKEFNTFYDRLRDDIHQLQMKIQNNNSNSPYISSIYNLLLSLILMVLAFFYGETRGKKYARQLSSTHKSHVSKLLSKFKERIIEFLKRNNLVNKKIHQTVQSTSTDIKNEIGELRGSTNSIRDNIDKLYKIIDDNQIDNTIISNLKNTIKDIEQSTNSYNKYYKIILKKQRKFEQEQKEYTNNILSTLQKQQSDFYNNMLNNLQEHTVMLSKNIARNDLNLNEHLDKKFINETRRKRSHRDRVLSEERERFYDYDEREANLKKE